MVTLSPASGIYRIPGARRDIGVYRRGDLHCKCPCRVRCSQVRTRPGANVVVLSPESRTPACIIMEIYVGEIHVNH